MFFESEKHTHDALAHSEVLADKPSLNLTAPINIEAVKSEIREDKPQTSKQEIHFTEHITKQADMSSNQNKTLNEASEDTVRRSTIYENTTSHLHNLNSQKLDELSKAESHDFRKPKPLIDKTKEENKRSLLRKLSADFVPPGTNIIVIAEYARDEQTIIISDNCMTIKETDLNDRVYRGNSVYTFGGQACAGHDKYFGQLQKSLDKYTKK